MDSAFGLLVVIILVVLLVLGSCAAIPNYNVYTSRLSGEAKLAEANSSREIKVREAQASLDAAKLLNQADIERAKGAAEPKRHELVVIPFYVSESVPVKFKITYTEDPNNPDPTIEVVNDFVATEGSVEVVR